MNERLLSSLDETRAFAFEIARDLEAPTLLLLEGPMGAGKTQFTTFLVEALGGNETASPSFAIHNSYAIAAGFLEHFDLFRLTSVNDLESTGFWDVFESIGLVVIEWSERLKEFGVAHQLPASWPKWTLTFSSNPDGTRTVRVS